MLPTPSANTPRLADVLLSSIAATRGEENPLGLTSVTSAIVVLVDGLGMHNLSASSGHARTLMSAVSRGSVARTVFPSTTAAALASLSTAELPGQHGLVGYAVRDPASGVVRNQLTGWGPQMPSSWQRMPTLFERSKAAGLRADAIGLPSYASSGFTGAVLRGADYVPGATIADRLRIAASRATAPGFSYVYIAELDQAGHAAGWQSPRWLAALEELDAALRQTIRELPHHTGLILTADHGMIDVPSHRQLLVDQIAPELIAPSIAVAGEPRALSLYLADATEADRAEYAAAWERALGDQVWALSREQAIAAGLFGEVAAEVVPRIGDVLLAARTQVALYDSRSASPNSRAMIGQHGSLSDEETRVPLLRFGAFSR